MAHTYTLNIMHCVFSTKGRLPLITGPSETWDILRRVAANAGFHVRAIGGTSNHVHLLLDVPSTRTIADVLASSRPTPRPDSADNWVSLPGRTATEQ